MRDGRVLPFRMLQARLQRKTVDAELLPTCRSPTWRST